MALPGFIAPKRNKRATKAKAMHAVDAQAEILQDDTASAEHLAAEPVQTDANATRTARKPGARQKDSETVLSAAKGKAAKGGGRKEGEELQSEHPLERQATVELLRGLASRPQILDLMEQVQPGAIHGAVKAMLGGAVVAGAHGAADRASMWRVLGMPWVGENGNAKQTGALLGAALGEAVARLEGHRGHVPVTLDGKAEAKALADKGD